MMRTVAFLLAVALAGCSAKYGDMGITGGVEAQQVSADTWRISASGNAYTSRSKVQDFVLMKAAEITKAAGATHFVVAGSEDASRSGAITTPGTAQTTFSGRSATTTFTPGQTYGFVKPGQDAIIRTIRVPSGALPPPGAISADEIIQFVGPRLR